jgi:hypothetical protein
LQILVVANPANTNALILKEFAPSIPDKNITFLWSRDKKLASICNQMPAVAYRIGTLACVFV